MVYCIWSQSVLIGWSAKNKTTTTKCDKMIPAPSDKINCLIYGKLMVYLLLFGVLLVSATIQIGRFFIRWANEWVLSNTASKHRLSSFSSCQVITIAFVRERAHTAHERKYITMCCILFFYWTSGIKTNIFFFLVSESGTVKNDMNNKKIS